VCVCVRKGRKEKEVSVCEVIRFKIHTRERVKWAFKKRPQHGEATKRDRKREGGVAHF
jgi:hypothetical protein